MDESQPAPVLGTVPAALRDGGAVGESFAAGGQVSGLGSQAIIPEDTDRVRALEEMMRQIGNNAAARTKAGAKQRKAAEKETQTGLGIKVLKGLVATQEAEGKGSAENTRRSGA